MLFGTPVDELVAAIREEIIGDQLTLEQHPEGIDRLDQHGWLVQHSLWLIHCEQLIGDEGNRRLDFYLSTKSIPKNTEILVCIEDGSEEKRAQLEKEYGSRIRVVTGKRLLVAKASSYLNTANPIKGRAGKEYILAWNNAVCTLLDEFGEANYG
ncbi:hypothetical protein SY89_02722 [Halolamina pelagica]|uniref:Uncharacterized protein n=2 Tax=Halolamina pelagica TaxID=699431 RepID=A0A0P7GRP0_9EURY|nr:hypothetical protein SY89_02722 [Halolamina pelagica]